MPNGRDATGGLHFFQTQRRTSSCTHTQYATSSGGQEPPDQRKRSGGSLRLHPVAREGYGGRHDGLAKVA